MGKDTLPGPEPAAETPTLATAPEGHTKREWPWWLKSLALLLLSALFLVAFYLVRARQAELAGRAREQDAAQYLSDVVNVFTCCIFTWEILPVVLPAFLLGGAAAAFIPAGVVLRYLGAQAKPVRAYVVAATSGLALALCSCSVIPLFVSIYRRGAGTGPAFAFLYAGPAVSIVPILVTMQVIGWQIGIWRLIAVPIVGVLVGLGMALLFRRDARDRAEEVQGRRLTMAEESLEPRVWVLFCFLLAVSLFGAFVRDWAIRGIVYGVTVPAFALYFARAYGWADFVDWMRETLGLVKLILPILLPLILIIGAISTFVDIKIVYRLVGAAPEDAGLWRHLQPLVIGTLVGALMYFPELSEVAFTKALLKLQMPPGPGLAILMAGAGLSLPGLFILSRAIGVKKAVAYEILVMGLVFLVCCIFSSEVAEYLCACMMDK